MKVPFDAHNHIHLGPSPAESAFLKPTNTLNGERALAISGMAIMSTHPQDFELVTGLSDSLPKLHPGVKIVPCYGVHPWFLHSLEESHWKLNSSSVPSWLAEIESLVEYK